MDYVVAGFGIGAILALVGFALWELYGNVEEPGTGWLSRAAIGLMLGALVIWSITGVTLISTIDDATGSNLVLVTTLVTVVSVAVGTFWYWRADQAYAASVRPKRRSGVERPMVPMAAHDDGELSEWDSWPEREASQSDEPAGAAKVALAGEESFEPEVAAEAVEVAGQAAEVVPETEDLPTAEVAVAAELGAEVAEVAVAKEAEVEVEEAEPAADELERDPAPVEPMPSNLRPIRLLALPAPAPVAETDDAATAEDEAVEPVAEGSDVDESDELGPDQPEESDKPVPDQQSKNGASASATFESTLLADIDAEPDEGDGRYRSPLLADLVPDPNEMKGVGLAKWRPEARLSADEADTPRKSRMK